MTEEYTAAMTEAQRDELYVKQSPFVRAALIYLFTNYNEEYIKKHVNFIHSGYVDIPDKVADKLDEYENHSAVMRLAIDIALEEFDDQNNLEEYDSMERWGKASTQDNSLPDKYDKYL